MEGGAEEFLLKPVQKSDLNKLHSYLLKSLHSSSNYNAEISNDEDDNGSASKRKAVSAWEIREANSEKRPKIEGFTVMI